MICIPLHLKTLTSYSDMHVGKNNFDSGLEISVHLIFYLCICDLCMGMFDLCAFLIDVHIFDLSAKQKCTMLIPVLQGICCPD